jgi:hypothetical protein
MIFRLQLKIRFDSPYFLLRSAQIDKVIQLLLEMFFDFRCFERGSFFSKKKGKKEQFYDHRKGKDIGELDRISGQW